MELGIKFALLFMKYVLMNVICMNKVKKHKVNMHSWNAGLSGMCQSTQ